MPLPPAQPAQIKFVQGDYPFTCRGDIADFCVEPVDNATHYTWTVSNTGIGVTTTFNGRAARVVIGPTANWTGTHTVSVRASNIYGDSAPKTITFGLNKYECGGGGPDPEMRTMLTNEEQSPLATPELEIFPNPATHSFTVSYTLNEESFVKLTLIAITGKVIKSIGEYNKQPAGNYQVNYSNNNLNPGVYIVLLRYDNGLLRKKIVLN